MDLFIGEDVDIESAKQFANQFGFNCFPLSSRNNQKDALYLSHNQLGYLSADNSAFYPRYPVIKNNPRRRDFSLLQAFGSCRSGVVLDLTAGFGRDSYLLYKSGYSVYSVEKSNILSAFVVNKIIQEQIEKNDTIRWECICEDAMVLLKDYPKHWCKPHVVYIDPMFEEGLTKGAVQKTTAVLRSLADKTDSFEQHLDWALGVATSRVIVKRAKRSSYLGHVVPSYQVKQKRCRFDVYIIEPQENGH